MKSFLICVFAFALVFANDFELLNQMAEYDYGKTVIQTIQIELESGENSTDRILELLKSMKSDTESEMDDSKNNIRARQAQCSSKLDEVDAILKKANNQRADDLRAIPLREEEMRDKLQQLAQKQGQEQRSKDRIKSLDDARNAEKEAFHNRRDEASGVIEALGQAKQIISQLASQNSFLQRREEIKERISNHQDKLIKMNKKGYITMLQMLLESATDQNADSKLVGNVMSIIDELIESLHQLQRAEMKAEEEKNQVYLQQRARFELEIATMEGSLATLKADSEHLKQKLLELNNDISAKEQVIDQKNNEKQDWDKTCKDEYRNYELITNQKQRVENSELDIVTSCIEIFETRFSDSIKSYVQRMKVQQ